MLLRHRGGSTGFNDNFINYASIVFERARERSKENVSRTPQALRGPKNMGTSERPSFAHLGEVRRESDSSWCRTSGPPTASFVNYSARELLRQTFTFDIIANLVCDRGIQPLLFSHVLTQGSCMEIGEMKHRPTQRKKLTLSSLSTAEHILHIFSGGTPATSKIRDLIKQ